MLRRLFIPTTKNKFRPYLLRKPALVIYTLFLVTFNVGYPAFFPESASQVIASSITAGTLISLTNAERQNLGLTTLTTDSRLTNAAYAKANDMLTKDYWNHFGPNGETPWQFITSAGYTYVYAGENLAKGFSTSEGVHQAWMASPTHRANIVNGNYRDIGIAVVEGELLGEQTTLVVQMFGAQSGSTTSTPSSQPSTPQPSSQPREESGEIKSISIVKPADGETVKDPSQAIEGTIDVVERVVGSYKVRVTEEEVVIGESDSAETDWSVGNSQGWEDGEHEITARVEQDDKKFEDSVKFTLDSTPPAFEEDDLVIEFNDEQKEWELTLYGSEVEMVATVQVGSKPFPMEFTEDGVWFLSISDSEVANHISVKLLLADAIGNVGEHEILSRFIKPVQDVESVSSILPKDDIGSFTGFLQGIPLKSEVNVVFGMAILGLISLQVYHYYKLGKLSERGGYLLTTAIWVFLLLAGTFVGTFGSVV
ncbi:MAG: CAP domain-containing protein [Candidatus Dojkabacteria bacterium]|nr:MAG: CAP domain-containing protein [Candidatus Dojkabacteria bacterium]